MKSAIWIGVVVVVAIIVGFLLYNQVYKQPQSITSSKETTSINPTTKVKEFVVEGSEFKFDPATITVNKNDAVRIIFKNVGSASHNFVIPELDVKSKVVSGGGTDTVEFVVDKSGTFSFYCSISGHKSAGMEGKLEVN